MNNLGFLNIDHHSVIAADLEKSKHFYHTILGLEIDLNRPDLPYDGLWFKVANTGQAIHLLRLPNYDPVTGRPEHGGLDRHVALKIVDLQVLMAQLDRHQIFYSKSKSGRGAIFFRDPDGNAIEVIQQA